MSGLVTKLPSRDVVRGLGFLTPEDYACLEAIEKSRYFLLRIDGPAGERWRCKRCHAKHAYFTLMCVERPFAGRDAALHGYWQHTGAAFLRNDLPPEYRAGLRILDQRYQELASGHPLTAHSVQIDQRDAGLFSLELGVLEPISPARAAMLAAAINARGIKPPFELPLIPSGGK